MLFRLTVGGSKRRTLSDNGNVLTPFRLARDAVIDKKSALVQVHLL